MEKIEHLFQDHHDYSLLNDASWSNDLSQNVDYKQLPNLCAVMGHLAAGRRGILFSFTASYHNTRGTDLFGDILY